MRRKLDCLGVIENGFVDEAESGREKKVSGGRGGKASATQRMCCAFSHL